MKSLCDRVRVLSLRLIDDVPWLLGHRYMPLAEWLARMTLTRESLDKFHPGPCCRPCHISPTGNQTNDKVNFDLKKII